MTYLLNLSNSTAPGQRHYITRPSASLCLIDMPAVQAYHPPMGKEKIEDPVMAAVRKRVEQSGLTYQQIGERMGYTPASARQAVSQFLRTGDPQISMLRRFADAMGISLHTLLFENRRSDR